MRFDAKKCYILSINGRSQHFYSLDNEILKQVPSNPYLGVLISEDLKWSPHILNITKKASRTIGFLRRNLRNCPAACRRSAYMSLVRSITKYGSIIWDPYQKTDIDRLERIQHQAARFITGDYRSREVGCVSGMLRDHNIPPLQTRRRDARLTFMYRVVEGLVPAVPAQTYLTPAKPKRSVRAKQFKDYTSVNVVAKFATNNSRCFVVPNYTYEQNKNSFFARTVPEWNNLEDSTVCATSTESFRNSLSKDTRERV